MDELLPSGWVSGRPCAQIPPAMQPRRRKFWGWGWEDAGPNAEQQGRIAMLLAARLGIRCRRSAAPPRIEEITLRAPRVAPPAALAALCSTTPYDRAGHTYGKSFRDVVRGFARDFAQSARRGRVPDRRARGRGGARLVRERRARGDSVRRRLERRRRRRGAAGGRVSAASSRSTSARLDRVLEIDRASRAARIQAGVLGPALEDQLRPHGLTLRHFPQSFEFSSLGGWIATRSGGHYATLYTHIDEFVESLRVVTPTGVVETRRLPGSGAGPSPDRLFIGSEGIARRSSPRRGCGCRTGRRCAPRRR